VITGPDSNDSRMSRVQRKTGRKPQGDLSVCELGAIIPTFRWKFWDAVMHN